MPVLPRGDYEHHRMSYSYVPAKLVNVGIAAPDLTAWRGTSLWGDAPTSHQWATPAFRATCSSIGLDQHHETLLNSPHDIDNLQGLLSVVFWGNFSDRHGRFLGYALPRAQHLITGRRPRSPQPDASILAALRTARGLITGPRPDPGRALQNAMEIKFLGMSFASKVLSFMAPDRTVVYDAVISQYLQSDFSPDRRMGVAVTGPWTRAKAAAYAGWCGFCAREALDLNAQGSRWQDWDGMRYYWRAVDIERAHFARAATLI